eukprot:symbB.v1.2.035655.t1/scaffold4856.1/size33858/2
MAPIRLIRPDVKPAVPTDEQVRKYLTLLACENAQALQNADFESSASAVFAAKGLSESTTLAAAVLESLSSIPSQVEAFREESTFKCHFLFLPLNASGHALHLRCVFMAGLDLDVDDLEPQHVSFGSERRRPSLCSMSDIFNEEASNLEMHSPSHHKEEPPMVSEEMNEDTQAMFSSLESLAEAASMLILAGQVDEALNLLEQAFSSVEAEEDCEIALAGVGVQILLCAGLSQARRHEEALEIAKHAVQSADAILDHLEDPPQELAEAASPEAASAEAASTEGEEVKDVQAIETPESRHVVPHVPLALLQRALELSVQSRQCQALEMEFLGPRSSDIGLDFWQKLMAEGLPRSSKVRQRAEQSKREWQLRAADATLPKLQPGCSGALQAWRCMLGAPRKLVQRSSEGLHLPRHERLYQGLPPAVDLDFERWRRHPSYTQSTMEPSTPSSTNMEKGRGSISAHTLGSWSTNSSMASTGAKSTSRHQLPRGDLYGTEGKSSWALRTVRKRDRVVFDDKKMNAFEDWRKNGSGPKMRLRDQVLQTEKGIQYFHDNLKKESYRFKNFWLKDMVTQDDLYEDRTFYSSEGLRVLKKNPRRQLRPSSPMKPQAKRLFDHYGLSCPQTSEPSTLHLQVSSYSELLQKSQNQARLDRLLPYARGNRYGKMSHLGGHFDALRVILRKHRRQGASHSLPGLEFFLSYPGARFLDPGVLPCVLDAFLHATGHATLTPQLAADFVRFCVAYRIHCYFQTSLLAPVLAKPAVVFILGGPGAGKGTQCERISQTFGYYHLSAGDLLREERKREGSEYGQLIESYIKEGKLVPVEIVVNLLKQAMEKHGWSQGKFLVDGFPRSFENMEGWERVLGGKVDVKFALFFNCSETVMEARILERGKTSGRADDNPEAIKKRLATFTEVLAVLGQLGSVVC